MKSTIGLLLKIAVTFFFRKICGALSRNVLSIQIKRYQSKHLHINSKKNGYILVVETAPINILELNARVANELVKRCHSGLSGSLNL